MVDTYTEFQSQSASEKVGLVILEAAKRLVGWEVHSGSIYKITGFEHPVIVSLQDSGVALTEAASIAATTAGKYFHDRDNEILYARTSDSANPNGKFIGLTFRMFFSSGGYNLPYDLSTGFQVHWEDLLQGTSDFGVTLDNQNQLGEAIEGTGTLTFFNDSSFWQSRYDKLYFENQRALVYSWSPELPITEAKLIYRGRIQGRTWSPNQVTFKLADILNELRAPVALSFLGDYSGARVPTGQYYAKQRKIYGYVQGHRPSNIDQVLSGYPLTGTFSLSNNATALSGSGTAFLTELTPGDQIFLDDDTTAITIESISGNTAAVVTAAYTGAEKSAVTATVKPSHPKRYINREFLISGHALCEPETTVIAASSSSQFELADATDFIAGDVVIVGSESATIRRVSSNTIKLMTALQDIPTAGVSVTRQAVSNVYLNDDKLTLTRDYTYSAEDGTITLTPLAEFYAAPVIKITGTLTFTNTSRNVTGSGTVFSAQLKPGDWIRASGQADYFEVLTVTDDTNLVLRSAATYSGSLAAYAKKPEVYEEGKTILSCDVLGATDDGTTNGALLKTAPEIVEALLTDAGLGSSLNTASFTTAKNLTSNRLGLVIPKGVNDTNVPALRAVINEINKSDFGSLVQNEDFELEYQVVSPDRATTLTRFDESDILGFSIISESDRIVKTARVRYGFKEYDPTSRAKANEEASATSDSAQYLAGSTKEYTVDTLLVDEGAAQVYAARWAFLFEVASSRVKFDTKLQGSRLQVGDRVELSHEKLYHRVGSTATRKVAAVQSARRSLNDSALELEDLANAFSRCAVIAEDDAVDFADASERERSVTGYVTGAYGYISSDASDFGTNLLW